MQHTVKIYSHPVKLLNYLQGLSTFFPQKPPVKKIPRKQLVKKMSKVHLMIVSVAPLLWPSSFFFLGGGTLFRIFFCACVGPPNFFAPGPSNGIKRVGPRENVEGISTRETKMCARENISKICAHENLKLTVKNNGKFVKTFFC